MAFDIHDPETDRLVRTPAERNGIGLVEAIELAAANALRREDGHLSLRERIRPIQDRILAWPAIGLEADRAFYDELSGDV